MSNFVDRVRAGATPAEAGTTVPRPNRRLQASTASIVTARVVGGWGLRIMC